MRNLHWHTRSDRLSSLHRNQQETIRRWQCLAADLGVPKEEVFAAVQFGLLFYRLGTALLRLAREPPHLQ